MRAYYNNAGDIVCLYKTEHKAFKQYTFIEITDAQHKLFIEHQQNYKIIDGKFTFVETPAPTLEQIQKELTAAVQLYMDSKVQEKGYDSILTACTYATSADLIFAKEAQTCIEWRDAVWRCCYKLFENMLSGSCSIMTQEEFIAELPPLVWGE